MLLTGCSKMGSGPQRGTAFALTHGRRLSADTHAGAVSSSLTKEGAVPKRLSSRAATRPLIPPHLAVAQAVRWTGRTTGAVSTPTSRPIVMVPKQARPGGLAHHS